MDYSLLFQVTVFLQDVAIKALYLNSVNFLTLPQCDDSGDVASTVYRDENEPETIEDMTAEKPDGWLDDEPELVPDETAEKPSDWSVL